MARNLVSDIRRSVVICPSQNKKKLNLLAVFIVIVTPARIAQFSYDKARLLATIPFGWLALGLLIRKVSESPRQVHHSSSNQCAYLFRLLLATRPLSHFPGSHMVCGASSSMPRHLPLDRLWFLFFFVVSSATSYVYG